MALGNHANYGKVGFTVILGVVALVASLVYFGGYSTRGGAFLAETYYDTPVTGLNVGSDVTFRGVKVGEVKSISFIGSDYPGTSDADRQCIRVVLSFNRRFADNVHEPEAMLKRLVRKGVCATVSASGITGIAHVELNYPKVEQPKRRISWTPEYICIPPAPSMLESFSSSAAKVMNHLNQMDLAKTSSNVTAIVESSAKIFSDASVILETSRPSVTAILSNLESATESLKEFAEKINREPSLLLRSSDQPPLPETSR